MSRAGKLRQKRLVELLLRPPAGFNRILELAVAAQVAPFAFETDGGPPQALGGQPFYPRHAAGVIGTFCARPDHLNTGAVDKGKAGPSDLGGGAAVQGLVAAAGGAVSVPEAPGGGYDCLSAVAQAIPSCPVPEVFCWAENGEPAVPLAGEIQFFCRMTLRHIAAPIRAWALAKKRTFWQTPVPAKNLWAGA